VASAVSAVSVLIIEDDRQLREFYRSSLKVAGYSVIAVEDGISALHIIDVHTPDVIVLDLVLPRLSGRDVYRELQATPNARRIPIIVVSGTDVRDLKTDDFARVLRKPVDPDSLVKAVDDAVRGTRRAPPEFV